MPNSRLTELSREQLYERVWSMPMSRLCRKFRLSDVGLAKICEKHHIPCPPRGYWARKRIGQPVQPIPLPVCHDPNLQVIRFSERKQPPSNPVVPDFDPDVAKALGRAEALGQIKVKRNLRNPHPFVQATLDGFSDAMPDSTGLVFPRQSGQPNVLNVRVAKVTVMRAMLFLDALLKAVEKIGGKVAIRSYPHTPHKRETFIEMCGEPISTIYLRERYFRYEKKPDPAKTVWSQDNYEYVPSGLLVLEAWGPGCKDTEQMKRIEDGIGKLIVGWIKRLGQRRIAKRIEDEKERKRKEEERLCLEREAELKRRKAELHEKQRKEQTRVDKLLADAAAWQQSKILRDFIRLIETREIERQRAMGTANEIADWLAWANQQADRLDPFTPSPPSILDERL